MQFNKQIFKSICLSLLTLVIVVSSGMGQKFPNAPKSILKNWDYYKLVEILGEGKPIVDTLKGQAYISGMWYQEEWLGRNADVSYQFKNTDIANFQIRFWSPYIDERTEGEMKNITDPVIRDSLLRVFQIQDSIRIDSVNRLLLVDPELLEDFKADARNKNDNKKRLYDLDSLRCDSVIEDISSILGPPIRKGMTHHTDRLARYQAVWVNNGIAISLRDFTDYTDIAFSIPFVSNLVASSFEIDPNSEVLRKLNLPIDGDTLNVSLLTVPLSNNSDVYTKTSLLVESQKGSRFVEKFHYDLHITNPTLEAIDFNNDGSNEIWLHGDVDSSIQCQVHQIYTLKATQPIVIFDSKLETDEGLSIQLLHGFQAEVTLADGSSFWFPMNKTNKAIQGIYNSTGLLLKEEILYPGCLQYLKHKASNKGTFILEGRFSVYTFTTSKHVCDLVITWDLIRGIWEIVDYLAIDPE